MLKRGAGGFHWFLGRANLVPQADLRQIVAPYLDMILAHSVVPIRNNGRGNATAAEHPVVFPELVVYGLVHQKTSVVSAVAAFGARRPRPTARSTGQVA